MDAALSRAPAHSTLSTARRFGQAVVILAALAMAAAALSAAPGWEGVGPSLELTRR